MRTRSPYDTAALFARLGVGGVFAVHGWHRIQIGVSATARDFHGLGVVLPTASAIYATFVELLAGGALIIGFGLPLAGGLLFLDMVGALAFARNGAGPFATGGGQDVQLVIVLALTALLFAAGGSGRFTFDQWLFSRGQASPDEPIATSTKPLPGPGPIDDGSTDLRVAGRPLRDEPGPGPS